MTLAYRISIRLSAGLLILLAGWSFIFYYVVMDEINDETDDALEYYSETIIRRALAGEELPTTDDGTNNSYYITPVTPEYASVNKGIRFFDRFVYIEPQKEEEPARVMKTIYRDAGGAFYELTVSMPTIEKKDLKEAILRWIVLLYLLLILVVLLVNRWLLRKSLRPLTDLLDWFDKYQLDKMPEPIQVDNSIVELRKLTDAAYRNAERNAELYEQQKQFIGNASHELQTPLAVCKNRLEILSDDPGLTEYQLEEIIKVRSTLDRIIRLNKTLLVLTRIENRQFNNVQPVEVNTLIRRLTEDYKEVYAYRQFHIVQEESTLFVYNSNEGLAVLLFSNLLKNAFHHTPAGGDIHICIHPGRITISNTAAGGPLEEKYIFRRFYHTSTNGNEPGTGLGLALVYEVCRLYTIQIRYLYRDNMHAFTLTFPVQ